MASRFPELGDVLPTWNTIDLSANVGRVLELAARQSDKVMLRRLIDAIMDLRRLSNEDESLVYALQDILRQTVASGALREQLTSVLNARTFGQLAGYIEYLSSKQVVAEMAHAIQLRKREA